MAPRKELDDNPTPSGNSLMATVLLRLARLHGDARTRAAGGRRRSAGGGHAQRAPHGFGHMLQAISLHLAPPREVAVIGPAGRPGHPAPWPMRCATASTPPWSTPSATARRPAASRCWPAGGWWTAVPAAYVCERFACQRPVTEPEQAAALVALVSAADAQAGGRRARGGRRRAVGHADRPGHRLDRRRHAGGAGRAAGRRHGWRMSSACPPRRPPRMPAGGWASR